MVNIYLCKTSEDLQMNISDIFLNMSIFARVRLRRTCMCRMYVCLCKLKTPSSYPMLPSLACTPPLQERDHTSELGTLIPQSTCKLGRKFENSPRSESNAAKFLGDEHIGGQPLTTLWTAKERLCQNFFLKLAAAFVLNNLSQSASKGSLIGESFLLKNKMYF